MAAPRSGRIRIVPETGSTNADLLSLIMRGEAVAEGAWLVADRQRSGRGRQGRTWHDAAGNFMGSTVVSLAGNDPPAPSLALAAGLAVRSAVLSGLPDPRSLSLKWPNDLLLHDEKIAGILLERSGSSVVIGIGVNLRAAPSVPDRLVGHLGAVHPTLDRDRFAQSLAESFDLELAQWRQYGLERLIPRWLAAAHPVGTLLSVHAPDGGRVSGRFDGLAPDGALRLRLADGDSRVIHAGDVALERN